MLSLFIETIKNHPDQLTFENVIETIDHYYEYIPTQFSNGGVDNAAGGNEGSWKVFAFAQLNKLNEQQTLACFAEHYRDVLADPHGESHGNIRQFIQNGWRGIKFDRPALKPR